MNAPNLSYINEQLRELALPLSDLTQDPANVRVHPARNIDAIKASLTRFGQRLPIVVQRDNMLVRAGNARLEAAQALGWSHIAAVVVDEGDVTATAFAIADNRTAELAEWDLQGLADIADALRDQGFDLDDIGYSDEEFDELTAHLDGYLEDAGNGGLGVADDGANDLPESTETITKENAAIELGRHILICANCAELVRVLSCSAAQILMFALDTKEEDNG
jgi:ParB-like chromosome segregation protein Spo0J